MKHYLRFLITLILTTVWCAGGYAQETVTIWSEDWSTAKANDLPSKVNSNYSSYGSGTKVYNEKLAGGKASPELLISKNSGSWTVTVTDLKNCSGELTLTYMCNKSLTVSANNEALTLRANKNNYTSTFSVSDETKNLTIVFTNKNSSNARIDDIVLTGISSSSDKTNTTLTFPEESYSFATTDNLSSFTGQTATLTAGDETLTGKTISYSKTGDDIFSSFDETTGVLSLNGNAGTATVKATFAGDDTYDSSNAYYTISVKSVVKDIATLKSQITSTSSKNLQNFTLKLTDAIVTYVNKNTAYIQDATAGIYVYASSHGLENNQKINGLVDIGTCLFNGLPEIASWSLASDAVVTENATFDIETVTLADLTANYSKYECKPVKVAGAVVTKEFENNSGEISQDGTTYVVYNKGGSGVTITEGDNIDIIGYPSIFNGTKQLYLWKQSNVTVNYSQVATTISFDPATTEYTVEKGKESAFKAPTVTVRDADDNVVEGAKVTYKSSNTDVATVAEDGTVSFVGFGTTTITASYAGDATHKAAKDISYTIIYGKVKTTMTWSATEATAKIGEAFTAPTLSLTANGESILDGKTITYESEDENVAAFVDGTLVIGAEGTTKITAKFDGDDTYAEAAASYTLTVVDPNKLEAIFDFANSHYGYGTTSSADGKGDVPVDGTIVSGDVTITHIKQGNPNTTFYASDLRAYNGAQLSISVPVGYNITKVVYVDKKNCANFTTDAGELNGVTWTGMTNILMMTFTGTGQFSSITVNYAKCPEVTVDENSTEDDMLNLIINNTDKTVNAKINRSMTADGGWYTFSVPFDIADVSTTALAKAEIRKYKSMTGSTMNFESTTELNAGRAYLIKPTEDIVTPTFYGVTLSEGKNYTDGQDGYKFVATLGSHDLKLDGTELFLGADNKFYAPKSTDNTLKALRGYFVVPEGTSAAKMNINIDGETTKISSLNGTHTFDGKVYNLNGQYVGENLKSLNKGVYIVNGKKIVK